MRHIEKKLLIILIALVWAASALSAERCSVCGEAITGKYYIAQNTQPVCENCYARYGSCRDCGLVSKSLVTVDGAKFCRDCYLKLPQCGICNKTIIGGWRAYPDLNLKICLDCEKNSPRCENCGRPVRELLRIGTAGLCEQCSARAQRCRSCGTALLRDYTYFEGNEALKYCADCVRKYPACADCGAPSGADKTKLDDNRVLCPECMKSALFQPRQVTPIKSVVIDYLQNNLGMSVKHRIAYSMEGRNFLEKKSNGIHGDLNGLFYRKGDEYNIYVLYGLRRKDLILVLAHEISHAWQAENTRGKPDLEDLEGFAQWVAYQALRYFDYDAFAATLTGGNTVYAGGLNKMLDLEKAGGARAVFEYIRSK